MGERGREIGREALLSFSSGPGLLGCGAWEIESQRLSGRANFFPLPQTFRLPNPPSIQKLICSSHHPYEVTSNYSHLIKRKDGS